MDIKKVYVGKLDDSFSEYNKTVHSAMKMKLILNIMLL